MALGVAESAASLEEAPGHLFILVILAILVILEAGGNQAHIKIWVSSPEPSGGYRFDFRSASAEISVARSDTPQAHPRRSHVRVLPQW